MKGWCKLGIFDWGGLQAKVPEFSMFVLEIDTRAQ